jgi:hypothetical protein
VIIKSTGKFISSILILILIQTNCFAKYHQVEDAQLWENISVSVKLTRLTTFHFNHEGRIANNISLFHYAYGDFGITRMLNKHFKVEGDYVLVWKQTEDHVSWRHQFYTALIFKQKLTPFELELRGMYQQQYQDIYSSDLGRYPSDYLRGKFTLSYKFNTYPFYRFEPYFATETYYHLDNNDKYGSQFDRMRYFVGCFYSFNKKNTLELYYLFEKNFNTNDAAMNYVIGIGYELNL